MWCDADDAKNRAIYVAIRSCAISYEYMVAWVEGWEKNKTKFLKKRSCFLSGFFFEHWKRQQKSRRRFRYISFQPFSEIYAVIMNLSSIRELVKPCKIAFWVLTSNELWLRSGRTRISHSMRQPRTISGEPYNDSGTNGAVKQNSLFASSCCRGGFGFTL